MNSKEIKIKNLGGRPKKSGKREIVKGVRFTKIEFYILKQKASRANLGISSYIRQIVLEGKIIAKLNEEERHFVRQLSGMANNLNQLTKKAHQEGMLTAILMFEKYKKLIEELLEKMKDDK